MSSATSSLRWSPCGRLATGVSRRSYMATVCRMDSARSVSARWSLQMLHRFRPRRCLPSCVACTARRTFSSTLRLGNRLVSWNARPRPACVRAETDCPVRSCPPSVTLPLVALSCPEMRLKYVVLPAPLGPTMAVSVPGSKEQVTALTATWPPKRMVKSLVAKVLMGGGSLSRSSSFGSAGRPALAVPGRVAFSAWSRARTDDVVVGACLFQRVVHKDVPQPHALVGTQREGVAAIHVGTARHGVGVVAGRGAGARAAARCGQRGAGCSGGHGALGAVAISGTHRPAVGGGCGQAGVGEVRGSHGQRIGLVAIAVHVVAGRSAHGVPANRHAADRGARGAHARGGWQVHRRGGGFAASPPVPHGPF